jgi:hypothetical protein
MKSTDKVHPTPTPWTLEVEEDKASDGSIEGNEIVIPGINWVFFNTDWADPDDWELSKANAAHIVRCVNEREGLLVALRHAHTQLQEIADMTNREHWMDNTQSALVYLSKVIAHAEREEG